MTVAQYETSRGEKRWEVRYRKPDGASSRKRGFMRRKDAAAWKSSHSHDFPNSHHKCLPSKERQRPPQE